MEESDRDIEWDILVNRGDAIDIESLKQRIGTKFKSRKCKHLDDRLVLSDVDRDIFVEVLENPPEPSEELRVGIRQFKQKGQVM